MQLVVRADQVRGGNVQRFRAGLHDTQSRVDRPPLAVVDLLYIAIELVGEFGLHPILCFPVSEDRSSVTRIE